MSQVNPKSICPHCKEEIKEEATKCKHCHSRLNPKIPTHDGTCPFCKEEIQKEATKCKHCKSNLTGCTDCDDSNNFPSKSDFDVESGNDTSLQQNMHVMQSYFKNSLIDRVPGLFYGKAYRCCDKYKRGFDQFGNDSFVCVRWKTCYRPFNFSDPEMQII